MRVSPKNPPNLTDHLFRDDNFQFPRPPQGNDARRATLGLEQGADEHIGVDDPHHANPLVNHVDLYLANPEKWLYVTPSWKLTRQVALPSTASRKVG